MKNNNDKNIGDPDTLSDDNARLRTRIQDLETYIDGRKARWEAMANSLHQEREAIGDLETAVKVRDARIAGFARTTAQLERRIDGQRRDIDGLRKRVTRSRSRGGARSKDAGMPPDDEFKVILRGAYDKLASMRTEQNRLKAEIEEKDAYIDRLCGKLSELEVECSATSAALRRQRKIIDHIEAEIRSRLRKVALSSRKPQQRRAISASILKLDEERAKLRAKIEAEAVNTMGRLTMLTESDESIEYDIGTRTITIGRGDHNDIRIRRNSVSREHARLTPSSDGMLIEDLASRNGIRVNDQRIARHRLRSGDVVAIGRVRFRFTTSVIPFERPNTS